jgi:hypothetical protein
MSLPWNSHQEYMELHDRVKARIDFAGVHTNACPHGAETCDNMIRMNGRYAESCPRFGGCDPAREGATIALCKGDRYFEKANEPIPKEHGARWKEST